MALTAGTRDLEDCILRWTDRTADDNYELCLTSQLIKITKLPPPGSATGKQRAWDEPVIETEYSLLLNCYSEPNHRARLLAAAAPHSGDWLHELPIAACGLHLDDESARVAVS